MDLVRARSTDRELKASRKGSKRRRRKTSGKSRQVGKQFATVQSKLVMQGQNVTNIYNYKFWPNFDCKKIWPIIEKLSIVVLVLFLFGSFIYLCSSSSQWLFKLPSDSLPDNVPYFVGRQAEMQEVTRLLLAKEKSSQVVNIAGAPGFGKSALAVAIGHALLGSQVYVHYVNMMHTSSVGILITSLNSVTVSDTKPRDKRHLLRWVINLTRQHVFILDNCDEFLHQNIEKFLSFLLELSRSSKKLKIITTCQYQYNVPDMLLSTASVGPLAISASVRLLQSMSSDVNGSAAIRLSELTGNAALALKVIGALLRSGENVDVIIKELKQTPIQVLSPQKFRLTDQVQISIETGYKRLSNEDRVCLGALAVFNGNFEEKDAAAVLSMTPKDTQTCVRSLKLCCFIEYNRKINRLQLHKLIQAFILESKIAKKPFRDHYKRYLGHYLDIFLKLSSKYESDPLTALQDFDKDQTNFHAMILQITRPQQKLTRSKADSYAFNLTINGQKLLQNRVPLRRQRFLYEAALSGAPSHQLENQCDIMLLLARTLFKLQEKKEHARLLYEKQTLLSKCKISVQLKIVEDVCLEDDSLTLTKGNVDCYGDYLYRLGFDLSSSGPLSDKIGWLYLHAKDCPHAATFYSHSQASNQRPLDIYEAQRLSEAALSFADNGMLEIADEFISRARVAIESSQISPEFADLLFQLGRYFYLVNTSTRLEAKEYFERAYEMQKRLLGEEHDSTLTTIVNLGHLYSSMGKHEEAINQYKTALRFHMKRTPTIRSTLYLLYKYLATCFDRIEHFEEGGDMYQRYADLQLETEGKTEEVLATMIFVGRRFALRGQLFLAFKYYKKGSRNCTVSWTKTFN